MATGFRLVIKQRARDRRLSFFSRHCDALRKIISFSLAMHSVRIMSSFSLLNLTPLWWRLFAIGIVLLAAERQFGPGPTVALAERIQFRCDELEPPSAPGGDEVYCTVSGMYVNYTTIVDCDVYPLERSEVRVIKFYNSHMLYIPAGLLRLFNDVREMDISFSEIVDVSRSSFEGAKHLVFLTLSHNRIAELRASTFVEATGLFMLDLSHNNIAAVDKFAFVNAQSLARLNLGHNEIGELDEGTFRDMIFLEQIYLNDNRLSAIDANLFANNANLQKIVLDNNRLLLLDMTVFAKCLHLELIRVSGNRLHSLNATVLPPKFKTLAINNNTIAELYLKNSMEVLEASNNRIRSLIVEQPLAMRTLLLANNSLTDIRNVTAMENLESLDLSQNQIGRLAISTLVRLKSLTVLNLAQTALRDLNFGSFAGQKELKVLDVSYNNLSEIHLDILSPYLSRLERLYLDGNGLSEVGGLFQVHLPSLFPALNTLGISNNNFNCTYLTKMLRTLTAVKIKLPVDPELDGQNGTHVSGIACALETATGGRPTSTRGGNGNGSQQGTAALAASVLGERLGGSVGGFAHFAYQRTAGGGGNAADSSSSEWDKQKLLASLGHNDAEFVHLHQRFAQSQLNEQLLRDNLFTLKLILVLLCVAGLACVTVKCVTFYRQNQHVWPIVPSMYRSTTTMNTLQCSLETQPSSDTNT